MTDKENFSILNSNSYLEMLWKEMAQMYTVFSNRLNTGDKLTITSSVTKDVHTRPCISLIKYHMQIYTS